MLFTGEIRTNMRIPYSLRRVPKANLASLLPCSDSPQSGDIALARLEKIGKNATLELANGRRHTLHEGDLFAVVFGNRYATLQFEGYARANGHCCDLLSMAGLCGLVESKHASVAEPSKLRLLGAIGDVNGCPLRLREFALPPAPAAAQPRVVVICGSSMDAGKTHTATSLIIGLQRKGYRVAGVKLTGTAAGRDTWSMLDAGACVALDFIDGGYPSTYLCTVEELLDLYGLLINHAASQGAEWVVVEIADGLLQRETAALLQTAGFTASVDAWILAATDPLAAAGGVSMLRGWGIKPVAVSGLVSMSPLCIRETEAATKLPCLTAKALQCGHLNARLMEKGGGLSTHVMREQLGESEESVRRRGRVYVWTPDPTSALYGRVTETVVPLLRLDTDGEGNGRLWSRHVRVRNGGAVHEPDSATGIPIGDARPNAAGDFLFEPGRGGGRMDKLALAGVTSGQAAIIESGVPYSAPEFRWRYIQAAHFGEVNTYFHLDRIAAYVDDLLHELGAPSLPGVLAVVNAHDAVTEQDGLRDGVRRGDRWLAFQGGHYRLLSRHYDVCERTPVSPNGEIHLGPGWQLLEHGALVEAAGGRYRANASHNAGTLYHEYGHHITRHTADFRANALRPLDRQSNHKTAMDEGTCDYWAATMLGTPHIWAWHRRHDAQEVHVRSLTSSKTMADYDRGPGADAHANGTIWAAALWDLRRRLGEAEPDGVRQTDLLVLKALLLLGRLVDPGREVTVATIRRARQSYAAGLTALLQAAELLNAGRYRKMMLASFAERGIQPAPDFKKVSGVASSFDLKS
jgi:hypothetical protein